MVAFLITFGRNLQSHSLELTFLLPFTVINNILNIHTKQFIIAILNIEKIQIVFREIIENCIIMILCFSWQQIFNISFFMVLLAIRSINFIVHVKSRRFGRAI